MLQIFHTLLNVTVIGRSYPAGEERHGLGAHSQRRGRLWLPRVRGAGGRFRFAGSVNGVRVKPPRWCVASAGLLVDSPMAPMAACTSSRSSHTVCRATPGASSRRRGASIAPSAVLGASEQRFCGKPLPC